MCVRNCFLPPEYRYKENNMRTVLAWCLATFAIVWSCGAALGDDTQAGVQRQARLNTTGNVELRYWLYLPKEYTRKDPWPLLLFLHGAGERGDDLEVVKKHGPPKKIAAGEQFPFIVVSPQCPKDDRWQPAALSELLDDLAKNYKVDQDRIYVTGLSMAHSPGRFAAIVPICGGGDPERAKDISHIPVWVFHGAKDTAVSLKRSEDMVEALKAAGGSPKFTVYPEAGHDSWTESYNNPDLYKWLLQQKRAAK
jgi:predicted peptidase